MTVFHYKKKLKLVFSFVGRHLDYKMGLLGAFIMSTAVFVINYTATSLLLLSFTASLKQWIYTFFFSGLVMKACENLSVKFSSKFLSIFLAVVIPSLATLVLTFIVHSFKGTPKPFESTLPTLIVFSGTFFWALKKRHSFEKKLKSEELRH